jgi:hypothetical protein
MPTPRPEFAKRRFWRLVSGGAHAALFLEVYLLFFGCFQNPWRAYICLSLSMVILDHHSIYFLFRILIGEMHGTAGCENHMGIVRSG